MAIEYITKEGLQNLHRELEKLENIERPKISEQIADARDKGDLSENAEYDAAKEAQGLLELKIQRLKEKIYNARIIDKSKIDTSKVSILSKVKIKNLETNEILTYTLVPETETNINQLKISIKTPIAKGMIGKKINDIALINLPNGKTIKLKILEISK